ncbi:hypothetical protein AJ87_07550 [Rhizobium yanglingense]|nr:hypothetical protein AJ87_07550 [Rhizobium yanglingense]
MTIKNNIAATDVDNLGDACARVVHETEQHPITLRSPCCIVGSIQNGLDRRSCQETDQRTIGFLDRNGESLLFEPESFEIMMSCVFEECSQRGNRANFAGA